MTDHAIVVEGLGKRYSLSAAKERHDTLRDEELQNCWLQLNQNQGSRFSTGTMRYLRRALG